VRVVHFTQPDPVPTNTSTDHAANLAADDGTIRAYLCSFCRADVQAYMESNVAPNVASNIFPNMDAHVESYVGSLMANVGTDTATYLGAHLGAHEASHLGTNTASHLGAHLGAHKAADRGTIDRGAIRSAVQCGAFDWVAIVSESYARPHAHAASTRHSDPASCNECANRLGENGKCHWHE